MTNKESITIEMSKLARKKKTIFLGENIINSGRIYGTMDRVPLDKCVEMPVAENLIAGTAIGLAIAGYHPICIFQRMDFMFIAADAIINHACMYPKMCPSIKMKIIFRTIVADLNNKFFVGYQHSKNLTHVFDPYMEVVNIPDKSARTAYEIAGKYTSPILIVESYKDYNKEERRTANGK